MNSTSDDDDALWKAVIEDVKPIKRDIRSEKPKLKKVQAKKPSVSSQPVYAEKPAPKRPRGKGIDGHIAEKLRKGQLSPAASLDLHGQTQAEAQHLIVNFILASHAQGHRLVCIITGTGARTRRSRTHDDLYDKAPGILKRRFEEFIGHPKIDHLVLHFQEAHRKHGSAGAYYVYLRRKDKAINP